MANRNTARVMGYAAAGLGVAALVSFALSEGDAPPLSSRPRLARRPPLPPSMNPSQSLLSQSARHGRSLASVRAQPVIESVVAVRPQGATPPVPVRLDRGQLVIDSVDAWVEFAVDAIDDALRRGMRGPEETLAYIMRMAIPEAPWPPVSNALRPQWDAMVRDVAAALRFEPEPQPQPRAAPLRIIR